MNPIHSAILAALPHRSEPAIDAAYRTLKASLGTDLDPQNEILDSVEFLEKRPHSPPRQSALLEALDECGAEQAPETLRAAQTVLERLKQQADATGTATIDIEQIEAVNVHIKKLLAEGDKAAVRVGGVKAKNDAVLDGLSTKSDARSAGSSARASSSAQDIQAGRDVKITQNTYVGGRQGVRNLKMLRQKYLRQLFELTRQLYLTGIDRKAAGKKQDACLDLGAVYIALATLKLEQERGNERPEALNAPAADKEAAHRTSALEHLNRHKHLVLLGDPGSGKSTFAHFVTMCLAGELLREKHANLRRLSVPPPEEDDKDEDEEKNPQAQEWRHGPLLPVLVVLRDFAAWLRQSKQQAGAAALWKFLKHSLEERVLGDFTPLLARYLDEGKVLLLLDGFDEVPESEQRREQLKGIVEAFVKRFHKCRVLLTSRTYAYQRQDWQLQGFAESVLAPFSRAQIQQFVEQWYAHFAEMRGLTPENARGQAELLKHAILESSRLAEFAERPLLLTLMASLHAWRSGSLPEKREELYNDAVELLLDWWESPKVAKDGRGNMIVAQQSLTELLKVGKERVRKSLNALAFQVHKNQRNLIGTADISEGDLIANLMQVSRNKELRHAYLIDYLSERAGLLVARGVGIYSFPHRTFQEYLAA
ncbi:MAG: NACHT domain-containing protein, partial [bacterium]|nr:NACHT domain-containing protein [bacterium]